MKIVILDTDALGRDLSFEPIAALGDCVTYPMSPPETVKERIADAQVVVTNKVKLTGEVLSASKDLKLVCVAATGFDNIDVAYCKERGVAVCNVVGYSSHNVAQVTAAMVLSLSVCLKTYRDYVSSGAYTDSGLPNKMSPVYHEIFGKTWGLVGYGNIAKEVEAVAKALGCRVIVHRRTVSDDCTCVSLEELCRESDVISVHIPLSKESHHLINRKMIELMKQDVILVNTARGAVLDEEAVTDAIEQGRIGAFGTDVYSVEPFPKEHPFTRILGRDNVCLTPHMAWGSIEARTRCICEIAENIKTYLAGGVRNRLDLL